MGQYYNAVTKLGDKRRVVYYHHQVDGEYMMAKLMEHSYWANPFVLAVASKFWRTKGRLAWVGDYAEPSDFNWKEDMKNAHSDKIKARDNLVYDGFRLEGKVFINHTKKEFIDLDNYKSEMTKRNIDMIINPVSLITAVGNDKGGGDFHSGEGYDMVGYWAWDEIEITDQDLFDWNFNSYSRQWDKKLKPEFEKYSDITMDALFIEEW